MAFLTVAGRQIYFEPHGDRTQPPLLYLHGGPGDGCLDFYDQAENLSRQFYVICFDQLGSLRSEAIRPDEPFGMQDHIKLIEAMREQLKLEHWAVLGHGFGGMLACLYARQCPQSVTHVIYDCPSFNFTLSFKSIAKYYYEEYFLPRGRSCPGYALCTKFIDTEYPPGDEAMFADIIQLMEYVKDENIRNYLYRLTHEEYQQIVSRRASSPTADPDKWLVYLKKLIESGEAAHGVLPLLDEIEQPSLLIDGKFNPGCGFEVTPKS